MTKPVVDVHVADMAFASDFNFMRQTFPEAVDFCATLVAHGKARCCVESCRVLLDRKKGRPRYARVLIVADVVGHHDVTCYMLCDRCAFGHGSRKAIYDASVAVLWYDFGPDVSFREARSPETHPTMVSAAVNRVMDDLWARLGVSPPPQSPSPAPDREPS